MAKEPKEPQEITDFKQNVRNKSIRQLVKESRDSVENPKEEKSKEAILPVEESKEDVTADVHLQSPQDRQKELEEFRKAAEDAAAKAAEASSQSLKEEIQKIRESDKSDKEKKDEIKELRANWTGFDKTTGIQTPKDYDEIVAEARRLALEDFKNEYKQLKEQELAELRTVQEKEKQEKEQKEKAYQDNLAGINTRIAQELDELYITKKLVKPKNVDDMNDPAARRVKDLFEQAAAENIKRQKEGKPLIDSIAKYFFLYYQPSEDKQPAGADAPVVGNRTAPVHQEEKLDYFKDIHNPSFKQIIYRAKNALKR